MDQRDVLRNMAASSALGMTAPAVSTSGNSTESLEANELTGDEKYRELSRAYRESLGLKRDIEAKYTDVSFRIFDGRGKRITHSESDDELTVVGFQSGIGEERFGLDTSVHAVLTWTRANDSSNDPSCVVRGAATDFDDLSLDQVSDEAFERAIDELDVSRAAALEKHVSATRLHREDFESTYISVHSNDVSKQFTAGELSIQSNDDSDDSILYTSKIQTEDAVTVQESDLLECIKDKLGVATVSGCVAGCVNAETVVGAAACAACGCYTSCVIAECSQNVGAEFCMVPNFSCTFSFLYPPNAGSCCMAWGCQFGCGWLS